MTQPDDEFRARHAEIARLMNRHKDLLDLLRDDPLAASFVTVRAAQEEIFGEDNISVGGSGGTTKGDTDMNTENNEYRRILAESIARHKVTFSDGGAGGNAKAGMEGAWAGIGGGATVEAGGSTMAGAGGGVAGDVPRRKRTAMDELETRMDFGEFTLPDWMQEEIERAMELDSAEGGRVHTGAVFEAIMGLFERPCCEFIEALTWGVR